MEPWRGTLPMCRSWIRDSGRDKKGLCFYFNIYKRRKRRRRRRRKERKLGDAAGTCSKLKYGVSCFCFYPFVPKRKGKSKIFDLISWCRFLRWENKQRPDYNNKKRPFYSNRVELILRILTRKPNNVR